MKTLARITGVILIVLGILTIVSALALGVVGGVRDALRLAGSLPAARGAGLTAFVVLSVFLGHGVLLAGVGQGLWLLADIASRSHLS